MPYSQTVALPGYWSLVAGFMEPGETAAQAAIREVWEETGVRAQIASHVMSQAWVCRLTLVCHKSFD